MSDKELPSLRKDPYLENKQVHEPEYTQDSTTCDHDFVMKSRYVMECDKCGWGFHVDGFEDYENIVSRYEKKRHKPRPEGDEAE